MKNIYFCLMSLLLLLLLSGCSSKRVLTGLSPDEIRKQPAVMIANCDIYCKNLKVESGAVFSIEEIGGHEYHIHSPSILSTLADMVANTNTYTFPEKVLLLAWPHDGDDTYLNGDAGFIVYPNGKFAYEKYFAVGYNNAGGNWWLTPGECTFTCEYPFRLQDNQ